ncbi:aminodeoxychorismate synthase component I [Aliidiomarina sp. Khilg15.8]
MPAETLASLELPYAEWHDAAALFAPFAQEPWALLLDSAASRHGNSRYDILLRQPRLTLCGRNDDFSQDPFTQIEHLLSQVGDYEGGHPLPFKGGAAGYFAYDAGRLVEQIPSQAEADIDLPDIALGFYEHALIIDHQQQRSFVLAPHSELNQQTRFWRPHELHSDMPFHLTGDWQSNMTRDAYLRKIARIHEHLRAGDCYQINLAQRFSAPYQGSEWQAYQRLRAANEAPFSAFMRLAEGAVLSLSPERFIQSDSEGQVETKPIKGTRSRHLDTAADQAAREELANADKDQAENLMIVDLLRNDLSRVCLPGSVRVPALFAIESFAAVHHLVSTVHGRLPQPSDSVKLLRAAFPGGSITGAPKVSAMHIIESLEPHRRSVYCGSIGYINRDGSCDTNIAIRTLVAVEGQLHCWAGGGIVSDSDAEAEFQETLDKVQRILPVLQHD